MGRLARGLILVALLSAPAAGQTWVQRIISYSTVLGDALSPNPFNARILYGAAGGRQMYISRDRGLTWHTFGTLIPHVGNVNSDNVIKSIAVSPLDTNQFVLGVESNNEAYDRIMRTTDGGATWAQTWGGSFEYFGKPVEFKPYHPDTLYTMGNDTLWRSTDFGATWDTVRTTTGLFAAWCDAEVRRDSANVMFLGDFSSGIWKTYDYGKHWKLVYSTNGEIPSIAIDPFNPRRMYASKYSGGGGIIWSNDWGESWQQLGTPISPSGSSAGGPGWWVTCSMRDTGYVYFGVYTTIPGGIFVSADSGGSWRHLANGLDDPGKINYGLLAVDTLSVIAMQYNGLWRLAYTPSLRVISPNGGELLRAGNHAQISWSDTNTVLVRLDFSTDGGSTWQLLADSLPASQHTFDWTVPAVTSSQCIVRVTDAETGTHSDSSNAPFTIYTNPLLLHTPVGGEQWDVASLHDILWTSYGVDSLAIDCSTDGGSSWNPVVVTSAQPGRYRWTVPAPASANCLVRIADPTDTTAVRVSPAPFAIVQKSEFRSRLAVNDNGAGADTLEWGTAAGATDSIDTGLGEAALGARPPAGTFDARWVLPAGGETRLDLRDTLGGSHATNLFRLDVQPGAGGYPITLRWIADSIHSGTCILRDAATHGNLLTTDMRLDSSITIADTGIHSLELLECRSVKVSYGQTPDWALVSIPVVTGSRLRSTLFTANISRPFVYDNGYRVSDSLLPGYGYWLKTLPTDIFGCACQQETVAVKKGWNMIGSITPSVATAPIASLPSGIIASPFFGYGGGYFVAESLLAGEGYWLKVSGDGAIVLSGSPSIVPRAANTAVSALKGADRLTVEDGEGHSQNLYISEAAAGPEESYFEMPPDLPENYFQAKFANGGMFLKIPQNQTNSQEFPLAIRIGENQKKSIFFSWDIDNERKFDYILLTKASHQAVSETRLRGRGTRSFPVSQELSFALVVQQPHSSARIPTTFSLGRMYPNPFNPVTSFRYSVPEESFISITVYSLLGEEVVRLAERKIAPGEYEARWDGKDRTGHQAASGVYFVRMTALPLQHAGAAFNAVERALLIK